MPPPAPQVLQWSDTVLKSGVLLVYVGPGLRTASWVHVVDEAISKLNSELKQNGVPVQIRRADKDKAQVVLDTIPGNELHAQSDLDPLSTQRLQKVSVRIPATPRVSKTDPKAREVGPGVRLYIVVHELIHALGLTNAAHSNDDVFTRNPSLILKGNTLPSKAQATQDVVQTYDATFVVPPILLRGTTIGHLKTAWPS